MTRKREVVPLGRRGVIRQKHLVQVGFNILFVFCMYWRRIFVANSNGKQAEDKKAKKAAKEAKNKEEKERKEKLKQEQKEQKKAEKEKKEKEKAQKKGTLKVPKPTDGSTKPSKSTREYGIFFVNVSKFNLINQVPIQEGSFEQSHDATKYSQFERY